MTAAPQVPREGDPPEEPWALGRNLGGLLRRQCLEPVCDDLDGMTLAAIGSLPVTALESALDVGEAPLGA